MELLRSQGSKQMCNLPDAFQAYATGETQSVGSSTGVMAPSFTILSNSECRLLILFGNIYLCVFSRTGHLFD